MAPREDGLSQEPGFYGYQLFRQLGLAPDLFGKPFKNIYDHAFARLGHVDPGRVAMVGDTLHTDILGGSAAGFGTVLVSNYGVLKSLNVNACIEESGISPDYIVPQI